MTVILSLAAAPAFSLDSVDAQSSKLFIPGFKAYQNKDYQTAIDNLQQILQKYPTTQLRDVTLFWLAHAYYKAGNRQDAAQYTRQFFREYPNSPLKGNVDPELVKLAAVQPPGGKEAETKQAAEKKAGTEKAQVEKPVTEKAAEKKDAKKLAAEKAAAEKAAAKKAAAEKAAEKKLAEEKAAAEKREAKRLATEKAAAEKIAAEKAAIENAEKVKAASEKAKAEKMEATRLAAEKSAREKLAAEKVAAEKAEAARLAAENASRGKLAADHAEAEKAEAKRIAAEKVVREKIAADRAEIEKAEVRRIIEKEAFENAARERLAAEKSAAEQGKARQAADEKEAVGKAASEKLAIERAVAEQATRRLAAEKEAALKSAETRKEENVLPLEMPAKKTALSSKKKSSGERKTKALAMKEKAIVRYKEVIDKYPRSAAAGKAKAKLKKMGIIYTASSARGTAGTMAKKGSVGGRSAAGLGAAPAGNLQIINLEVGQFADFSFSIAPAQTSYKVGKSFVIPFEVVNQGNGPDSFFLEAGFPSEFNVRFSSSDAPNNAITTTPQLAPGEKFRGALTALVPRRFIDGQESIYPVKVSSQVSRDVSQSRQLALVASAPLVRAVIQPDKTSVLPGGKVTYKIDLLNIGTGEAGGVTLRLSYPPVYDAADFLAAGFRQEMKGSLIHGELKLGSGETREFSVTFQLKEDARARQELNLRAELVNDELESRDSFLSAATIVEGVSGVLVKSSSEKMIVIPGQTVVIPISVTNTGNRKESFQVRPDVPAGMNFRLYQDVKRDGTRQPDASALTIVGPLEPKQEAYFLMELITQSSSQDSTDAVVKAFFIPENDMGKNASLSMNLRFSRPIVELAMASRGGKLKPGEVSSFELSVANSGSNLARGVEIQSIIPGNLEMVSADLLPQKGSEGEYFWKFAELGAGEKRNIRVTFRVKAGIPVGTNIQVRNLLKYEDQMGNRY